MLRRPQTPPLFRDRPLLVRNLAFLRAQPDGGATPVTKSPEVGRDGGFLTAFGPTYLEKVWRPGCPRTVRPQVVSTGIRRGLAFSAFGKVRCSTPFFIVARIFSLSMVSAIRNCR